MSVLYVQETLTRWRIWAELWCCTNEASCPTPSTPANVKAAATKTRCSSTPAWLARTVPRGSCSTAPKQYGHMSISMYLTHLSQQPFSLSLCVTMGESANCCLSAAFSSPVSLLPLHSVHNYLKKSVLSVSLSSFSYLNHSTGYYYFYFFKSLFL